MNSRTLKIYLDNALCWISDHIGYCNTEEDFVREYADILKNYIGMDEADFEVCMAEIYSALCDYDIKVNYDEI